MTDNYPKAPITLIINHNGMGQADSELTHKLATTYLNFLDLDDRLPETICFYADGVKLTVTGSPVLEELRSLEKKGVRLIVCTTCLNHFNLLDNLSLGEAAGMKEIVEAQWKAQKTITL
ncbi:MAG: DsrE family protein [Gemmatimonadales bacterium]|nr:DsrE family protein [Gemmatimonadales bacterium]